MMYDEFGYYGVYDLTSKKSFKTPKLLAKFPKLPGLPKLPKFPGQRPNDIQENLFKKPDLQWLYKCSWWITGLFLYPYFWYSGKSEFWWSPKDPKLILINYVLNFLLHVLDVSMDFFVGYSYFPDDPWYGFTTLSVIILPALARFILVYIIF